MHLARLPLLLNLDLTSHLLMNFANSLDHDQARHYVWREDGGPDHGKKKIEYDQEMPPLRTSDKPVTP